MSITTEQSGILANIAIDEYVNACHADDKKHEIDFLSTLYLLVAQRMDEISKSDVEIKEQP